jgi:uncharacterized protein (TIGR03546 family)
LAGADVLVFFRESRIFQLMPDNRKLDRFKNTRFYLLLKKAYTRFLKIRGEPREIALGFSLGLLVGMTPAMGFHTVIAVFFATLFKWNKISAALAVWITNPFTAPVIYSMTYVVGAKAMGLTRAYKLSDGLTSSTFLEMIKKTPEIFGAMTIGGFIIGIPLSLIGYHFIYSAISRYQEDIKRKLVEQKLKHAIRKEQRKLKKIKKKFKKKSKTSNFLN